MQSRNCEEGEDSEEGGNTKKVSEEGGDRMEVKKLGTVKKVVTVKKVGTQ